MTKILVTFSCNSGTFFIPLFIYELNVNHLILFFLLFNPGSVLILCQPPSCLAILVLIFLCVLLNRPDLLPALCSKTVLIS